MQNGMTMLEKEINYTATPLPLALEKVGRQSNRFCQTLFLQAARALLNNKTATAGEAWMEGIAALTAEVPLTKEESEVLTLFGQGLGKTAKEEQLKNIELTRRHNYIQCKKS